MAAMLFRSTSSSSRNGGSRMRVSGSGWWNQMRTPGVLLAVKPASRRICSSDARVTRFMAVSPFLCLKRQVAKNAEMADSLRREDLTCGKVHRECGSELKQVEPRDRLVVPLYVSPQGAVDGYIIHDEDDREHLDQPASQISALDAEGGGLTAVNRLALLCRLDLHEDVPPLHPAVGRVREEEQIDPVIMHDSLDGVSAKQDLALDVVDGQVGDDVFA